MKPEIKKLWLAALRSGEYEQGRRVLRREDTFCCLGVLCDLHSKVTGNGEWKEGIYKTPTETEDTLLPDTVVEWAELDSNEPMVLGYSIALHNDGDPYRDEDEGPVLPKTFPEIADLIDQYL